MPDLTGDEKSMSEGLIGSSRTAGSTGTAFGDGNSGPEHYKSFGQIYRQPSKFVDHDLDDESELRVDPSHSLIDPLENVEDEEVASEKANTTEECTLGDTTGVLRQRRNGFAHSTDSQPSGVQLGKRVRSSSFMEVDDLGPAGKSRKNTTEQHSGGHYGDGWQTPSITITRPDENRKG